MGEHKSWIKVGPNGTFAQTGELSGSPADIDELLSPTVADSRSLLLHMHGGLVSESRGREIAVSMATHYGSAVRSLSFVWETALLETLRDSLAGAMKTDVFKKALSWVLAKVMDGLGNVDGARGSVSADQAQIERHLQSSEGIDSLDASLAAEADRGGTQSGAKGGTAGQKSEQELADELQFDIADLTALIEGGQEGSEPIKQQAVQEDGAKGGIGVALFLAKVIIAVWKRYRAGTHHDPLPTAIEELLRAAYLSEIGAFSWAAMKQKALDMWLDDGPIARIDTHVGGYFLRRLEELQKTRPDMTIDLVGHSAGSIVICAMLAAIKAQNRRVRIRNVIFLAPAVRLDTFRAAVYPPLFLERFRLFTMTDQAEQRDKLVPFYPRSLLFLVSGLFEDKPGTALAGLARHVSAKSAMADDSYNDLRSWLAADNRLVLSPSADAAAEGLRTRAAHHGDFDNDELTLASLLALAKGTS